VNVEISVPGLSSTDGVYLTWRPIPATIRLLGPSAGPNPVNVRISSKPNKVGARLAFATTLTHRGTDTLDLVLAADGTPVELWVGGKFNPPDAQSPSPASQADGDIALEVHELLAGTIGRRLGGRPATIRVRKNAETLTDGERDRFLSAMAALNGRGTGKFVDFRNMHTRAAYPQIHENISFLPWHRAYLLDLERELQADFPDVALPYWHFDHPAPRLFQPSFMGKPVNGRVQFSDGNPLVNWVGQGTTASVLRGPGVKPDTVIDVRRELECLTLSSGPTANFRSFSDPLEVNPHGAAHGSHAGDAEPGWIGDPTTSQMDPLFYLLHNNVDRLWAKWQWLHSLAGARLDDPAAPASYSTATNLPFGHNRNDTMWPWDGLSRTGTNFGRFGPGPPIGPGGGLAASKMTTAPGPAPTVAAMIDYFGRHGGQPLAFAYDDVPFVA
jgi:tyrosinase